jgi:hypothetical protein
LINKTLSFWARIRIFSLVVAIAIILFFAFYQLVFSFVNALGAEPLLNPVCGDGYCDETGETKENCP